LKRIPKDREFHPIDEIEKAIASERNELTLDHVESVFGNQISQFAEAIESQFGGWPGVLRKGEQTGERQRCEDVEICEDMSMVVFAIKCVPLWMRIESMKFYWTPCDRRHYFWVLDDMGRSFRGLFSSAKPDLFIVCRKRET
jgi:hypothetical protein